MVYKLPTLTQNLVSLPVLAYNGCTITLDRTIINVTKGGKHVMEGYMEQNTRLQRLKLEDAQKEADKHHQYILNDGNDQHINAVLPEIIIMEMLEFLTIALFIPVKSTLLRVAKNENFTTWTSITDKKITKFLAISEDAELGHMYQAHMNTLLTRATVHTDTREE